VLGIPRTNLIRVPRNSAVENLSGEHVDTVLVSRKAGRRATQGSGDWFEDISSCYRRSSLAGNRDVPGDDEAFRTERH